MIHTRQRHAPWLLCRLPRADIQLRKALRCRGMTMAAQVTVMPTATHQAQDRLVHLAIHA